ncbi:MAG: hypothetical protein BWK73_46785 [Thiothrix lacustris]|uniref:Peptidase M10 serralysin C-terminal domain-containing protein n=1 Tax=Thiothrix lacustris TaxID=525917 RepID=A0A1Y1QA44_9GAMM|nr:MAG: hypothetical protein BWK73_46785 [Thiothrix lacustris]
MARILLSQNEGLNIASDNAQIVGAAGVETVVLFDQNALFKVDGVKVDQNVERVEIEAATSAYKFQAAGNVLKVFGADDKLVFEIPVNTSGTQTIAFGSGSAVVKFETSGANAGKVTVGGVAVGVTAAALPGVTVNAADASTHGAPVTPPAPVGQTFNLTVAADAVTGTAQGDTIIASDGGAFGFTPTLSAGDNLNGGAGVDTLLVATAGGAAYSGFTATNIEVLDATSDAVQTFDLSGTTGLQTVKSTNSSAATFFNQVTSLVDLEVVNLTNSAAGSNVTVQYQAPVIAGAADSMKVMLSGSNAQNITIGNTAVANAGIETVNMSSAGTNSTVAALNTNLTTLNFSGDKDVVIGAALNNTVTTINAATATGGLRVATNTANALTFTGGAGDDQVAFAANTLTLADTVVGGLGNDRIVATQANLMASASKVSGVEYVRVSDTLTGVQGADNAVNFKGSAFADANRIELAAGYNNARIDNLSATLNRVDVLNDATPTIFNALGVVTTTGSNIGTLQLEDAGTSATADTFTIGLGSDVAPRFVGATFQNAVSNAHVNAELTSGSTEVLNIISRGTASTTTGITGGGVAADTNTLNVSAGTVNINTVNISGVEDLTLTVAASSIGTINASTATGNLNLTGVTFAATGPTTVTTGTGNDTVSGSAGADTVNTGAGDDTVFGSAGKDTITVGEGADTVVYSALVQSNAANTDTITDFASGVDIIDIRGLGATTFVGTQATFALAQGALPAGGSAAPAAVFQADANTLWVDLDRNGTLDANDFRVVMSGVNSLAATSVRLASGNNITLTAPAAVLDGINPAVNAVDTATLLVPTATTPFGDTINTTVANLNGSTINGLAGTDTLVITNQVTANVALGAGGAGGTLTNIENVTLQQGSTANVTIFNGANVATTANAPAIVTLGTGGQTFTGSAGNDQVATAAAPGNDTINTGAGNDQITVQGVANATVNAGAGDDTVAMVALGATPLTSADTLNGGDGTDALIIAGNSAGSTDLNNVTNFETIAIFGNAVASTYTTVDSLVAAGATLGVGAAAAGAAITFNGAAETNGSFSIVGSGFADTITGGAGADFIFGGGGADILVGGAGADTFAFAATAATNGADTITGFTTADRLDFTAFEATANSPIVATEAGILAAANGSVFVITDIDGSIALAGGAAAGDLLSLTAVANLFAPAGVAGDNMVVIIQDGTSGNSNIYYVDNGATAPVAAAEVALVGTLTGFLGSITDAMIV